MEKLDRKTLASFRLLVALARADGRLAPEERDALKAALGSQSDLLDALLSEDIDVDAEIGALDDDERRRAYQAGYALVYADGHASVDEVSLLRRIVPSHKGEEGLLAQVFGEARDTLLPTNILPEADPVAREQEILEDTLKYSILAAVAGAMPVPGVAVVADVAVIALQMKLVRDIGQYFGHSLDGKEVRAFLMTFAGSTGLRIAVNNLARLVPGWGSAFGAATSFATTFAIGRVAQTYFDAGRELDPDAMRKIFLQAKSEGAKVFDREQERYEQARSTHGARLRELNEQLASGTIDRAEYNRAVAELGLS